jgi:hypothetical protein
MGSAYGDTLLGSVNNDSFVGLAGDDPMDGRGGFDMAIYASIGVYALILPVLLFVPGHLKASTDRPAA